MRSKNFHTAYLTLEPSGTEEYLRITVDYPSKSSVFYARYTSLHNTSYPKVAVRLRVCAMAWLLGSVRNEEL